MGLKVINFAAFKQGKTVLGLSAVELGAVGYHDNEYHARPYLRPHSTTKPAAFPFDKPMETRTDLGMCTSNPVIAAAFASRSPIFLVETMEFDAVTQATEAFANDPRVVTMVYDSGSIVWDLVGDLADEANEESALKNEAKGRGYESTIGRLAWTKPKKFLRRMFYAQMQSGKHIYITAHVQEVFKEVDGKLTLVGVKPWLEKKSPHFADLITEAVMPEGKMDYATGKMSLPTPKIKVVGENLGGGLNNCFAKGTVIDNPTFARLVAMNEGVTTAPTPGPNVDELTHRNRAGVERAVVKETGHTDQQEEKIAYPHKQ